MELRQLEYFIMVSKLNSFTRAAEQLYVSQPGVTSAIRSLEEELGIQLFDRSQKQIVLTNEGRVFFNHVENVMNDITKTISEVKELKNLTRGTVKIGIPPVLGTSRFPSLLSKFKYDFPSLEIEIVEEGSLTLLKLLEKNELDLGIVIEHKQNPILEILPIAVQEMVACLYLDHSLKGKKRLSLQDIQYDNFIGLKDDHVPREILTERFQNGILSKIVFESNHIQTIKGLVASGAGISILPLEAVDSEGKLLTIPLSPPLSISVGLARKKNKYMSHAAQALFNFIKGSCSS